MALQAGGMSIAALLPDRGTHLAKPATGRSTAVTGTGAAVGTAAAVAVASIVVVVGLVVPGVTPSS